MDAAGKDGAIRTSCPASTRRAARSSASSTPARPSSSTTSSGAPRRRLPERGRIGIFNRSYYEEVLIVRVHPEILAGAAPARRQPTTKDSFWQERYRVDPRPRAHLHRNGTRIIKFFLHISKEEQRKRFLARIDDPKKNWKFSLGDVEERELLGRLHAGVRARPSSATSTEHAPWYVVPADDKKNARLIVSQVIVEAFESLDVDYPKVSPERLDELEECRVALLTDA